jgi:hypothetical protein
MEMSDHAFSEQNFARIQGWLRECEQNHPSCPGKPVSSPRRLIDLGVPEPPNAVRKIRLVQDLDKPVKYIALSHCWGAYRAFLTTKDTLEQKMQSITWNEFPKTFRDAIKVARKLHIRYLWIDSLCILQDDP